jgi:hypothetical protein
VPAAAERWVEEVFDPDFADMAARPALRQLTMAPLATVPAHLEALSRDFDGGLLYGTPEAVDFFSRLVVAVEALFTVENAARFRTALFQHILECAWTAPAVRSAWNRLMAGSDLGEAWLDGLRFHLLNVTVRYHMRGLFRRAFIPDQLAATVATDGRHATATPATGSHDIGFLEAISDKAVGVAVAGAGSGGSDGGGAAEPHLQLGAGCSSVGVDTPFQPSCGHSNAMSAAATLAASSAAAATASTAIGVAAAGKGDGGECSVPAVATVGGRGVGQRPGGAGAGCSPAKQKARMARAVSPPPASPDMALLGVANVGTAVLGARNLAEPVAAGDAGTGAHQAPLGASGHGYTSGAPAQKRTKY